MAVTTVDDEIPYEANRTLGRSGAGATTAFDRLHERANHLDALLCAIAGSGKDDSEFAGCNATIQRTVLELASSLAQEINELQEQAYREHDRLRNATRPALVGRVLETSEAQLHEAALMSADGHQGQASVKALRLMQVATKCVRTVTEQCETND